MNFCKLKIESLIENCKLKIENYYQYDQKHHY
jgi:hypothetical protein